MVEQDIDELRRHGQEGSCYVIIEEKNPDRMDLLAEHWKILGRARQWQILGSPQVPSVVPLLHGLRPQCTHSWREGMNMLTST